VGGGEVRKVDRIKHTPSGHSMLEDDPLVPVAFSRSLVRESAEKRGK